MTQSLELQKLELEKQKHNDSVELEKQRLALERRKHGKHSAGAITIFGAAIALASSLSTAYLTGSFGVQNTKTENQTKLDIERMKVEADLKRLEQQQRFEIIVQATKGTEREKAAQNLIFFVEAGILSDPTGQIVTLADEGLAPDIFFSPSDFLSAEEMNSLRGENIEQPNIDEMQDNDTQIEFVPFENFSR